MLRSYSKLTGSMEIHPKANNEIPFSLNSNPITLLNSTMIIEPHLPLLSIRIYVLSESNTSIILSIVFQSTVRFFSRKTD